MLLLFRILIIRKLFDIFQFNQTISQKEKLDNLKTLYTFEQNSIYPSINKY